MPVATVTSKGQTTIPKDIRVFLGLHSGDQLEFIIQDGEVVIHPATVDIKELKGMLARPGGRAISVKKMNAVIKKRFKEK